ncbi:unnamed protein product [Strongylus vulgaris]|uniref:Srp40 C-terminal domain-containing protein n=1 Tax=Strongylus vulgaris TaxID=40348 RepID=A0A3P7IHW1_STRVU|nr:unnamed protein product [Strongylus vulgaris]
MEHFFCQKTPVKPALKSSTGLNKPPSSSSSDSDSDEKTQNKITPAKTIAKPITPASAKRPASSSSSSSSEDESTTKKITAKSKSLPVTPATRKAGSSDSDSDADKKAKEKNADKEDVENDKKPNGTPKSFPRKSNEPFRRVTITKESLKDKFKDNSYDPSFDHWGAKAHEALSKVQGKGFRHEKTKKKKGSYGGGPISTSVNSIKFSDSD